MYLCQGFAEGKSRGNVRGSEELVARSNSWNAASDCSSSTSSGLQHEEGILSERYFSAPLFKKGTAFIPLLTASSKLQQNTSCKWAEKSPQQKLYSKAQVRAISFALILLFLKLFLFPSSLFSVWRILILLSLGLHLFILFRFLMWRHFNLPLL